MKILLCLLIGYLLGSLNPAALVSKLKHTDLRENGTGNLGATNTMLIFGKKFGAIVMLFDIAKAVLAVWCARWLASELQWLSLATGVCAVVGHCFPFYLKFKGGKGLAAFAGLVLAYNPFLFLFLFISGVALMLIVNYSFILPFYATVFFTTYVAIREDKISMVLLATFVSALIVIMHFGNFVKAARGQDKKIREYVKTKLFHSGNTD